MEKELFATVAAGSPEQKKIKVIKALSAEYKDKRRAQVSLLEDGTFIIDIINPPESKRGSGNLWLSAESLTAILSTIHLFADCAEIDLQKLLKDSINGDVVIYETYGINPPNPK